MSKRINFSIHKFELTDKKDDSFLTGKIYAIAEGLCRNNVDFTLASMEEAKPTVYNKPVLAAFNKTANEFEAHNDNGIKIDTDTGEEYVDFDQSFLDGITERPIGTIPQDSDVKIETYQKKNWLTFDVLIWKKYFHNAVKLLKKLGKEKVSVEITLTDWEETEDGVTIVHSFVFDGVTIIGVPEGIEGANIQVANFSQEKFGKFREALVFARKNTDENIGKENVEMKFDFKGMSLNTFHSKMWSLLESYTFRREGYDWDSNKYYVYDILPDENYVILEDVEEEKLYKVPFTINDEREIVLNFENKTVVEVSYAQVQFSKKVDFNARLQKEIEDKKNEEKEEMMELKFKEKFVENGYKPIYKFDKFVLFEKKDEIGKLYKLEFENIDKCEDEKFSELLEKFSAFESKEEQTEEMVAKSEFEKVVEEKTKLEEELKAEKDNFEKQKEEFSNLDANFTSVKNELETTKTELVKVKEEFSKLNFDKFKVDAEKDVEELKDSFGEEFDLFKKNVFELIEKKEITNKDEFEAFAGKQLFAYTKKQTKTKKSFGLNSKTEPKVTKSNVIDNI